MLVALSGLVVVVLSALAAVAFIRTGQHWFQFDFRGDLYRAGRAIAHGHTPYHPGLLQAQAQLIHSGRNPAPAASPRWPPPILLTVVPLSLLPFQVAAWLFFALSVAALIAALWLLGVRDWRCYVVALLAWPTVFGTWVGNISTLLLFGTAVVWRFRERLRILPILMAAVVGAKLLLWPLAVWLLAIGRRRLFGITALVTAGGIMAAWAAIGFADLTAYPHMLMNLAYVGERRGSSLVGLLLRFGLSVGEARGIALALAGLLLVRGWHLKRSGHGDGPAFGLAIMAALTASPVVWTHYLVLLYVPIALLSPALSPAWFLPMLALPFVQSPVPETLQVLVVQLVVIVELWRPSAERRRSVVSPGMPQALEPATAAELTAATA